MNNGIGLWMVHWTQNQKIWVPFYSSMKSCIICMIDVYNWHASLKQVLSHVGIIVCVTTARNIQWRETKTVKSGLRVRFLLIHQATQIWHMRVFQKRGIAVMLATCQRGLIFNLLLKYDGAIARLKSEKFHFHSTVKNKVS